MNDAFICLYVGDIVKEKMSLYMSNSSLAAFRYTVQNFYLKAQLFF